MGAIPHRLWTSQISGFQRYKGQPQPWTCGLCSWAAFPHGMRNEMKSK